jgi:quinol monooxygenase YgiN
MPRIGRMALLRTSRSCEGMIAQRDFVERYDRGMIIVSGWLRVDADDRSGYLASCVPIIEAARAAPGCIDFHLCPDPIEPERINVFEQWESATAVESFRGSGPDAGHQASIVDAHVEQHEIASTVSLS